MFCASDLQCLQNRSNSIRRSNHLAILIYPVQLVLRRDGFGKSSCREPFQSSNAMLKHTDMLYLERCRIAGAR